MGKGQLTERELRALKPAQRQERLQDGEGLYLLRGKRSAVWRLRFMSAGVKVDEALGDYPETTLAQARTKAEDMRRKYAEEIKRQGDGFAQFIERERERKSDTVEGFYFDKFRPNAVKKFSLGFVVSMDNRLKKYVFPIIGAFPIATLERSNLHNIVKRLIDKDKIETAKKITLYVTKLLKSALSANLLTESKYLELTTFKVDLEYAKKTKNHPAIVDPVEFGKLISVIKSDGKRSRSVYHALNLLPHVFLRAGELVNAQWSEVNLDAGIWVVPAERMKAKKHLKEPHTVYLSTQVIHMLKVLKNENLSDVYLFPQIISGCKGKPTEEKPISIVSLNNALIALGYKETMKAHAFRASFRTIGQEVRKYNYEAMELQLQHKVFRPNGKAYDRSSYADERRVMLQDWSNFIDEISRN